MSTGTETTRGNRAGGRRRQDGFTLIELMVVVVIVGILASLGLPFYASYALQGNLKQAIPVMMAIAAKERIHFNRTGYYLATGDEQMLQQKLGLDLHDAGDFCFMVLCQTQTGWSCGNYSGGTPYQTSVSTGNFGTVMIDTPDKTDHPQQFQVIAVLRQQQTDPSQPTTVTGAGQTCTAGTSPAKMTPESWIGASGAGSQGRVIVLSYPRPADGTVATTISAATTGLTWQGGVTLSDALNN